MIWFTSDTHFGHANIIRLCNRPFASQREMDQELVDRWNSVVEPDDSVYHLGDFTLGNALYARHYFDRLNGIIFVLGIPWHHDKRWLCKWTIHPRVAILSPTTVIRPHGQHIHLSHYPLAQWDRKHHGAWHLHGHSHGRYQSLGNVLDVGVDANNFTPVSLNQVRKLMIEKQQGGARV